MKKLIILSAVAAASLIAVDAFSQGQIQWGNAFGTTTTGLRAPIYGVDPLDPTTQRNGNTTAGTPAGSANFGNAPLLQGTGFTIALFVGNNSGAVLGSSTATDTSVFRTGTSAGFMVGPRTTTVTGRDAGLPVSIQIRAWDNQNNTITSWAQCLADPTIPQGVSDVYALAALGGSNAAGDVFPIPQTLTLRSFNLVQVPEPSLIALGALGLGALLFRRRKQS